MSGYCGEWILSGYCGDTKDLDDLVIGSFGYSGTGELKTMSTGDWTHWRYRGFGCFDNCGIWILWYWGIARCNIGYCGTGGLPAVVIGCFGHWELVTVVKLWNHMVQILW